MFHVLYSKLKCFKIIKIEVSHLSSDCLKKLTLEKSNKLKLKTAVPLGIHS